LSAGQPVRPDRFTVAWYLFQAVLFTLPWVGLGVVTLVTGRDLGAGLQPSWLLLFLVVVLLGPELVRFLRTTWRSWLLSVGPLVLALVVSILGLWIAPAGEARATVLLRFAKQVIQVVVMSAFVVVPAYYLVRGRTLATLARPVVWGGVFQLVYGALQGIHFFAPSGVMAGLERIFTSNPAILAGSEQLYLDNALQHIPRLRGTVCEPLYLGSFLLLALPLVSVTGWSRWHRMMVAVPLLGLLILTWSRGAWLAAVGGILIWAVMAARSGVLRHQPGIGRLVLGLGLAAAAVVLVGAVSGRPEVWLPWRRLQQSFSTVDWSNLTRMYSMQAAWRAFLLSPVVGIGWGQFGFHFAALVDPMGLQSMFSWPVVNNFPLEILCETGILGALGCVWLVRWVWRGCRQFLVEADFPDRISLLVLMAVVGAIWLQMLTFSQYNLPHIWLAGGLLIGVLKARPAGNREGTA